MISMSKNIQTTRTQRYLEEKFIRALLNSVATPSCKHGQFPTQRLFDYRIAGIFEGENFRGSVGKEDFAEKTFAEC